MLRTDGNFEATLDRKLTKWLRRLERGHQAIPEVREDLKEIILMAMKDDKNVYRVIGEGDPILGDDDVSLSGIEDGDLLDFHPTH